MNKISPSWSPFYDTSHIWKWGSKISMGSYYDFFYSFQIHKYEDILEFLSRRLTLGNTVCLTSLSVERLGSHFNGWNYFMLVFPFLFTVCGLSTSWYENGWDFTKKWGDDFQKRLDFSIELTGSHDSDFVSPESSWVRHACDFSKLGGDNKDISMG